MPALTRNPVILFAHMVYPLQARFDARGIGLASRQATSRAALLAEAGEADVIVASGLWDNALLGQTPRLRFVQSISAGVDRYDLAAFRRAGVRLASAQGTNSNAVSDHGMALILAMTRHIPQAAANQARRHWRGMIGHIPDREEELEGKTLLVVGLGAIGNRLARLARAFGMTVIGLRRDPAAGGEADSVRPIADLHAVLPQADFVALTCPLTPETEGLIDGAALSRMKPTARLVNLARGRVVDEPALIEALRRGTIAGAALDCVAEEPLPPASPLWDMPNVLITPHTGGETQQCEDRVIDILLENLDRLWRGEATLRNGVV
ncbi:phosphoglycerate dehydrogenase [Allostella vacuolata]|nr:phosphoglycerate dehydrogenase [Stella vacuolata]